MDKQQLRIGGVRVAVAVSLGVIAYTVSPSTGSLASAHAAGESTQPVFDTPPAPPPPPAPEPEPGECEFGFCGSPISPGGGCACGSGCSILVL